MTPQYYIDLALKDTECTAFQIVDEFGIIQAAASVGKRKNSVNINYIGSKLPTLGGRLMKMIIEVFGGANKLTVTADGDAVGFYKKFGFRCIKKHGYVTNMTRKAGK